MATKPTQTFTFATDANFTSGPATGNPTKVTPPAPAQGFVPGDAIAAEYVNFHTNIMGQWIDQWLIAGSSTAGLDAHLVETNANGNTAIAGAAFGATASTFIPLLALDNAGNGFTAAIAHLNGGQALFTFSNNTGPTFSANNSGTGDGALIQSVNANGVQASGGNISPGVLAFGGAAGGAGLQGIGSGIGAGVEGQGGPNGPGVSGFVFAAGGPALQGVYLSSPAAPLRGMIHMTPVALPAAPVDGDFWKRPGASGAGRGGLEWYDNDGAPTGGGGGKQRAWSTENGLGYTFAESAGTSSENAATVTTKVTATLGFSASPGDPPGRYIVEWHARISLAAGAVTTTRAEVTFSHPGGTEVYEIDFAATNQRKPVGGFIEYQLPVAGVATFQIQFRTLSAGNTVNIDSARIVARGAYE